MTQSIEAVEPTLQLLGISRRLDTQTVLKDVSLGFRPGTLTLLLGRNGAGKTTLLRVMATLLPPSSGFVAFEGELAVDQGKKYRREMGLLLDAPLLYGELTAHENLSFFARLYQIDDAEARIIRALDEVGLRLYAHEMVHRFSRGMVQRLAIARSLLHSPSVILWDEPLTAIDQPGMPEIVQLLAKRVAAGAMAIVVTHEYEHFWEVADRIVLIRAGRIAQDVQRREVTPAQVAEWLASEVGLARGRRL